MNANSSVTTLFLLAGAYLFCGVIFAAFFFSGWIQKLDEGAHGTSWRFKLIITPGTIVFWPLLWKKVRSLHKQQP